MERAMFLSVSPIGDTDPANLPVPSIGRSLPFYTDHLGFEVESSEVEPLPRITLRRDAISIGLTENGGDPEQASCYISVSDVAVARAECEAAGLKPTPIRQDNYEGSRYQVFFIKDYVGLCYCLGKKVAVDSLPVP